MSMYQPPHPRCPICTSKRCRASWLYVAFDRANGLVKIGKSVTVSARFIGYRKTIYRDIFPVMKWQASCDFLIHGFENAALSLLPESRRVRGDWYRIEPETAIRALLWVKGGLS